MSESVRPSERQLSISGNERLRRKVTAGIILICLALFLGVGMRHFFEPFRDYGKPFSGEPFYAIRALNYLRHGYFTNWLGVCDDLNPNPDRLTFKFTEMPAYFVVNSLGFRLFGVSSISHGIVELGYMALLFLFISLSAWQLFDEKTAALTSILMALIPVNLYLLYMAWIFVFPLVSLFYYVRWSETHSKTHYGLAITAAALGCLHHIAGYFIAPVLVIHALNEKSFRRNLMGLMGILGVVAALFMAYLAQASMLHQNSAAVTGKAFSESVLNLPYLKGFFSVEWKKLPPNYYELLTVPLVALGACWTVGTLLPGKRRAAGDSLILLWLLFPLSFFVVFLGMVASHLNFLTLFAPFLAVSASRTLLDWRASGKKHIRLRAFVVILVIAYTAFMCYRTQRKYDAMVWTTENERGYALASGLVELVAEDESVAGVNSFGYSINSLSPAFSFYLQRDYYGNISSVEQLVELMEHKKISCFLFPAPAFKEGDARQRALGSYLLGKYPFHIDPARRDLMIFDLREPWS